MSALAGCGRIGFEALTPEADASSMIDAGAGCTPWTNIVAQTALNGASDEWEPAVSPDGLSIAYVTYSTGPGLYAATRGSLGVPFESPRMLTELATASVEHGPAWSTDGTKLYFSREMGTSMPMVATYLGNATFAAPVAATLPSTGYAFALSADELEVFMTEDVGGGVLDLRHATRQAIGSAWQGDGAVNAFNLDADIVAYPAFDEPRNDLYFQKQTEVLVAHRDQRGAPFGAAVPVEGINVSAAITGDPSLTADGLTLAFASDRPLGEGASDIYLATRTCD